MSERGNMRRSQAITRLPIDNVVASLTLHDGDRADVLLFIPPGEDVTRLVGPGDPFVPMFRNARFCLVARDAIAAIGVTAVPPRADDDALPVVRQRAQVRLRSGVTIEGELRWTATDGRKRTTDHVNEPGTYLVVHAVATQTTYYVVKSQVATIEEV